MMLVNLLDRYSIIEISGEDHLDFLQGQLTNDIKKNEKKFIYSGMCNPKGRLFAFLRILRTPDSSSIFFVIPSSLADAVQKRLMMFILRAKVVIQKAENFHLIGIIDDNPLIDISADRKLNLPDQTNRSVMIFQDNDLYKQITTKHSFDDISNWIKKDIEFGIPEVMEQTQEKFLVHTCNLDLIDAVNFKKGCYTGQEIVARTHYLGKPKHRSFYGVVNSKLSLDYGEQVFENDQSVGAVVNFTCCEDKTYVLFEKTLDTQDDSLNIKGEKLVITKSFAN
ncbi:MAG: YgfZ/GcvT domain-containing protein [Methylophilaceae bacterium]|jgi:folate-binding protein YgfZ|nr:folate-binding protein [Betaproteobacteria bacterium]NCW63106.1 folate-binding protein [Betaproteobacteria bacterium]